MATSPLLDDPRYKELKLCEKVVSFFLEKEPWADNYNNVPRLAWYLFLQSNFSDAQGKWLEISAPDFLEKIKNLIEIEIKQITESVDQGQTLPPSLPPNLKQLVEEYGKAAKEEKKKEMKAKAKEVENSIWHSWELARNQHLLKQELKPKLKDAQSSSTKEIKTIIDSLAAEAVLKGEPQLSSLAEIKEGEIESALVENLPEDPQKTLTFITSDSSHQTQTAKQIFKNTLSTLKIPDDLAQEVVNELSTEQEQRIKTAFVEQATLNRLSEIAQLRVDYLQKRLENKPYDKKQPFPEVQELAEAKLDDFVQETLNKVDHLESRIGLPTRPTVIDGKLRLPKEGLILDTVGDILRLTKDSQNISLFTQPEEKLTESIQEAFKNAFTYNLRRPAIPNTFSALINAIPFLRSKPVRNAQAILNQEVLPKIVTLPPSLISSIKSATIQNFSASQVSIESGDPLGRIPVTYKMLLMSTDPRELDALFGRLQVSIARKTGKPFSAGQINTVQSFIDFLKTLQQTNPSLAKLYQFWGKHYIGIPLSKSILRFIITQPDYILHLPVQLLKLFGRSWLSRKWQDEWKPRLLDHIISWPGIGRVVNFLYKRNSWGIYEGPWTKLKKNLSKKVVRGSIRFIGKNLWRIGKALKIEALKNLGVRIFGSALTGGIGAIFFAAYPLFKDTLKKIATFFGAVFVGLLIWAYQHAAIGIAGFITGNVLGGIAGIKVGGLVFGATAPFLGPFAIIPAVIAGGATWLLTTAATTGLFIIAQDFLKGLWGGAKSFFSSLFGAAKDSLALHGGVEAAGLTAELAGTAGKVLAISGGLITGLYFYTQLVNTSSLLPPEGLEFLVGSRFIEIEKGVQVGEESDKNQFEDRYNLPNDICDPPTKTVYYQIGLKVSKDLTDIKITDKTTRTGEYGSVTVQEKNWEIGDLKKDNQWESEVYSFTLTPDFKDSYLSNTITVTSAEGEEKTITLTLKIGNPPLPPLAEAAEQLAIKLISCYGEHVDASDLADNGECLKKAGIPQPAVDEILRSVGGGRFYLQCVGFVSAASQMAGQPITLMGDAKKFYGKNNRNYRWHSNVEITKIKTGDIFVSAAGENGHIAIAQPPNLNGFRLVEVLGDDKNKGLVRYQDGWFITFDQAQHHGEWGFLRFGE